MNDNTVHHVHTHYPQSTSTSNGIAVAGFVCSILSLCLFWLIGVNFILWVLGIVFSAVGLSKANKMPGATNRGLSVAGLWITLLPATLLMIVFIVAIAAA